MRIFYASDNTPNANFSSDIWKNNLYQSLVDLGHDVVEFQYDLRETFRNLDSSNPEQKAFIIKNRPILVNEILRQIKIAHAIKPINVLFTYFTDACITIETLKEIKLMGIKTINWYCNGSNHLELVTEVSPYYDWCLVPEKFRIKDYLVMGARPIYCQEAANPNIYKPYDLPKEFDATFVGQAYGDRPFYIKYLLDQGIDVRVWGYGWENHSELKPFGKTNLLKSVIGMGQKLTSKKGWRDLGLKFNNLMSKQADRDYILTETSVILPTYMIGGLLSDTDMIKMYSRSKINLGFSTCGATYKGKERILQIRLRDFEAPMSGGFYMVEYMEELADFFEIGKEIVCYNGLDDLVEKIKYYLSHDIEREVIRRAGYERCQKDHTWHKRFENAFKEMGFSYD